MSAVYKVEVVIVSDYINYTEEDMQILIKEQIEKHRISELRVTDVNVISKL
jgi:hypothetical protein